jgi:2-polyprenyl-3-methyl-5-hydroxy-6-metoxy-1,4-benzoquinol methylase
MSKDKVKLFFNRLDYLKNSSDRIVIRSQLVKSFLGEVQNSTILDIGCGDGSLSLQFLGNQNLLTLNDISENMIEVVNKRIPAKFKKNVTLVNDSFEAVKEDLQFDIILCVGVIAHVPDVGRLFEKIGRLLKPEGWLIIETTPNPYPIGKFLYPYYFLRGLLSKNKPNYKKNRLETKSLLGYAKSMNLEVIKAVRYSFPLPGMSHWPQSLKLRYTLFTLNNHLMSRLGSEHVFLMRKIPVPR